MNDRPANIIEMFSSIQGEGLLVGLRQVFLRFHGCNLDCAYCDTNFEYLPEYAQLEDTPGRRDFVPARNPVSIEKVMELLQMWSSGWPGIHHSLSLTGGEPLLGHDILKEWLPRLKTVLPIYLETNGVLHDALGLVIDHLDYISMDIKLPSSSGYHELWDEHRQFMALAAQKTLFVKMVISGETEDWEIIKACGIISDINPKIPCILQPVTEKNGSLEILPIRMLEIQEIAGRFLDEVRVIPQTHKFMGQL